MAQQSSLFTLGLFRIVGVGDFETLFIGFVKPVTLKRMDIKKKGNKLAE